MSPKRGKTWKPRLGRRAQRDFTDIVAWTAERFGQRQALAYATLLRTSIAQLKADPFAFPSKARDGDVGAGLRTLHIARPGRHLLLYRVEGEQVLVLRILYDSMDLARHLPPEEE